MAGTDGRAGKGAAWLLICVLCAGGLHPQTQSVPNDPAALVQSFYESYPNELEGGLPDGRELDWLANFLTVELCARFRAARDYQDEWIRRNPDRPPYYLKPPFADGVHFTGVPDAIDSFRVLAAQSRGRGTWHVPIHFWIDAEEAGWEAVAVVKERRGRFLIDDILFLPDEPDGEVWCLSRSLEWDD